MSDHWSPEEDRDYVPPRRRTLDEIWLDLVNRYETSERELLRIEHRLARRIFLCGVVLGLMAGYMAGLLTVCLRGGCA